jgi:hypothetical protein
MAKTREEDFSSSVFEWVKTERQGDVCRFKEFVQENGIEFIVFTDNSRVNHALLGDVVLKHQHESQIMGREIGIPAKTTGNPDEPYEFPIDSDVKAPVFREVSRRIEEGIPIAGESPAPVSPAAQQPALQVSAPVQAILEKAKKKKQKVTLELQVELPSADVLNIVRENFNGSDEELYNFFIQKIDKKKFVSAIIQAVSNK